MYYKIVKNLIFTSFDDYFTVRKYPLHVHLVPAYNYVQISMLSSQSVIIYRSSGPRRNRGRP